MKSKVNASIMTGLLFLLCLSPAFGMGQQEDDRTSSGTGFFVNSDGYIITNMRVIDDANIIYVILDNREYYPAQLIYMFDEIDLAVLKIDYRNPYHFRIADFNTTNLGDRLSVLGFPLANILGNEIRYTEGNLSAKNVQRNPYCFQHSAPMQQGSGGSPIMNSQFEIIGIATAMLNPSAAQNVNFGIKSECIGEMLNYTEIVSGNGNIRSLNDAQRATVQIYCGYSRADNASITIVNHTGYDIDELYVLPTWIAPLGKDVLAVLDIPGLGKMIGKILQNGNSASVRLPFDLSLTNKYNILLIAGRNSGKYYIKSNVTVTDNSRILFTSSDEY